MSAMSARRMLDIDQLLAADEVLLCNSGWGVLAVREIERATIGTGSPGPVLAALREGLATLVDRETSAGALEIARSLEGYYIKSGQLCAANISDAFPKIWQETMSV